MERPVSLMPKGERVKRAIRWISGHLATEPSRAILPLVQEAALRFDLNPKESEELGRFYRRASKPTDDEPA